MKKKKRKRKKERKENLNRNFFFFTKFKIDIINYIFHHIVVTVVKRLSNKLTIRLCNFTTIVRTNEFFFLDEKFRRAISKPNPINSETVSDASKDR